MGSSDPRRDQDGRGHDESPARPGDPLTLRHGPSWPNRLVMAPLTNQQSNDDGSLHDDELTWLTRRAAGGFGVVMTCAAHVATAGKAFRGQLGVGVDDFLPGLSRLATQLRDNGAVSSVQLHHAGIRAVPAVSGVPAVAPWSDPDLGVDALTTSEIADVIETFAQAASRVQAAGFDGVEVHGAHGYLLAEFLNAEKNSRTDGYGGDFSDRSRIFFDVLRAVRDATGPDFQVGIRLSPMRWGIVLHEALALTEQIMASGLVDYVDMSLWDARTRPQEAVHGGQTLTELFAALPRHGTRLGVAGKVTSGADVQWCLNQGVDFVLVGTGAILHHDFANHVLADPSFTSAEQPVTRTHLQAEDVSPRFVEYLATSFKDFVR